MTLETILSALPARPMTAGELRADQIVRIEGHRFRVANVQPGVVVVTCHGVTALLHMRGDCVTAANGDRIPVELVASPRNN